MVHDDDDDDTDRMITVVTAAPAKYKKYPTQHFNVVVEGQELRQNGKINIDGKYKRSEERNDVYERGERTRTVILTRHLMADLTPVDVTHRHVNSGRRG